MTTILLQGADTGMGTFWSWQADDGSAPASAFVPADDARRVLHRLAAALPDLDGGSGPLTGAPAALLEWAEDRGTDGPREAANLHRCLTGEEEWADDPSRRWGSLDVPEASSSAFLSGALSTT